MSRMDEIREQLTREDAQYQHVAGKHAQYLNEPLITNLRTPLHGHQEADNLPRFIGLAQGQRPGNSPDHFSGACLRDSTESERVREWDGRSETFPVSAVSFRAGP